MHWQTSIKTKQNVALATTKQKGYIEMLRVYFDMQYVSYLQSHYKRTKE